MKEDFYVKKSRALKKGSLLWLIGAAAAVALGAAVLLWPSRTEAPTEERGTEASSGQEIRLEDGASLVQRLTYTRCEHEVTRRVTAPVELYGKRLEEAQALYPEWRVTDFSAKELRMERQMELFCPDHRVLLPDASGKLCVFENRYGDALALVAELETRLSSLPAAAQEEVQDGLGFSTLEELEAWLESMES